MAKQIGAISWLLSGAVGITLIIAGVSKLLSPAETGRVLALVGTPPGLSQTVLTVLPGIEIALGIGLVLHWRSRFLYAAVLGLFVTFSGFLLYLQSKDATATCSCFGGVLNDWLKSDIDTAILRNIVFLVMLLLPASLTFYPALLNRYMTKESV